MSLDVGSFRSQLVGDGARPNLFRVNMSFPAIAKNTNATGDAANIDEKLSFMCRTAQLPGTTIGAVPVNFMGREIKVAGNQTFPEWSITIINDEDFLIRNAFEKWMNSINSHSGNSRAAGALNGVNSPRPYSVDIEVHQLGKEQAGASSAPRLKTIKLIGAFPIDIAPIDLDWGTNDSIEEFSVTLAYQWWIDIKNGIDR